MYTAVFAGVEHLVGKEGRGFVGGRATIFLQLLLIVDALGTQPANELGAGLVEAGFLVDLFHQALVYGLVQGDRMNFPVHRIAIFQSIADKLIEDAATKLAVERVVWLET